MSESLKHRLSRTVKGSRLFTEAVWIPDRIVDRMTAAAHQPRYHLLIAATGNGNIGDQAMLEAFLENVTGEIMVVCESSGNLTVPASDRERVTVVPLPRFASGLPGVRLAEVRHFQRLLLGARSLSVTGADLMDGLYNPAASVARISALRSAQNRGIPSRVLGFSWSPQPHPAARRALRKLGGATRLLARDPLSYNRLVADGIGGVEQVADMVFAAQSVDLLSEPGRWADAHIASGTMVAIVNASALIGHRIDQVPDYLTILEELTSLGYATILLPHVLRAYDDDLSELRRISEQSGDSTLLVVDEALSPAQVRGLARRAHLVVTGRMHLAIMSLMSGAFPITLSTQGKVEGLYGLFGAETLAVEPKLGFATAIIRNIATAVDSNVRNAVAGHLPTVTKLARSNFSGL